MNESLVQDLFTKPLYTLELDDMSFFFAKEQKESNILEFKSYIDYPETGTTKSSRDKEKVSDIIKSICAFLNSDGGVLIWGAPKGKINSESGKEKIFQGDLMPVDIKLELDQVINKITSQISPIPHSILFHPIAISEDKFVYIFEVRRSNYSPHQFRGTYYMRLDGSTYPAPHHYVEALMKKISYPRIEGYLSFGGIIEFSEYAGIPIQVSIHNLSKFIHEKNVQYRIIGTFCDIVEVENRLEYGTLNYSTDFSKDAKDVLHYNMPYFNNFLLLTKRLLPGSKPIVADIMLTIWGELSPVISCIYKLEIFGDSKTVHTKYFVTYKSENKYLFENSDQLNLSDSDRLAKSRALHLKDFEERLHTYPLSKNLHNR